MEQLVTQMRVLIYTVICFQCLLQITQGSIYQKYLKLFMYLLTLCICCQILTNFVDKLTGWGWIMPVQNGCRSGTRTVHCHRRR